MVRTPVSVSLRSTLSGRPSPPDVQRPVAIILDLLIEQLISLIRIEINIYLIRDLEDKLNALDTPYMSMVEFFYQLRKEKPYEISEDFIMQLGTAYIFGKTGRAVNDT